MNTLLLPTRLVLVRHGETIANREFRYIGASDDALTEHGQGQAVQLAGALSVLPVAAVYSSPRLRAYQTALPIASRHGLTVQVLDDLREADFGAWEGLSRSEVVARSTQDAEQLLAWERDTALAPPGGESLEAMHLRVSAVVEKLVQAHPDQTVVLVSHVGPIKAILCAALGAPVSTAFRIFLDPATISVVDWRQPHPVVRLLNSHSHLGWQQARWMV
ncbi:MAG TPA: histidine phosphatase family protein [Ktedonobacteraceae bacterium]|nr:histidine phosphatase family protein [Ktedonobacteraceae bacterium]